ncbi:PTS sugar transporter subunit IIA, partial [Bacillus paralicheniformis]|uniref:PTS sugar transporter subunit IIA n=1 Tax=Bacillus paralicheniformis TaxID=1648923 RepID=UPI0021D390D8
VETMEAESSLEHTVKRICGTLEDQGLVKDAGQMADGLMKREAQGGLGIPGTTFALFHLKSEAAAVPLFKAYDLSKPFEIKGMDGSVMKMTRMLIMLAPVDLSPEGSEILSLISSSMIESDESIKAYQTGDREQLYGRLNVLFHRFIQDKEW